MTMTEPVAEVVERLRSIGGPTRKEAADLLERQQAEIERLSRERDTGVPEGFWLAPIRPTDEIMTAAAEAHFGKRRTAQSGGIDGIGMTVDGRDLSFRDAFKSFWKGARSAAPQPPTVSTQGWQDGALKDIGIERLRQMSVEGWTPEHDDTHDQFEMARAAAFYCVTTYAETLPEPTPDEPSNRYSAFHTADCAWPSTWDGCWRKPKDARRNLVRAAALIVAEIERLDRANGAPPAQVQPDLSTLTRERDQLKEELERAYKVDDQKTREINILTGENRKVYRERDQAREALELAEPILAAVSMLLREDRILVCRDEILTAALQRARSVLDPEKEEKA